MKKRIILYLVFSFGISWAIWIGSWLLGVGYGQSTFGTYIVSIGMYAPLAAVALLKLFDSERGRVTLTSLKPRVKGNVSMYLLALVVPTLATVAGAVVYFAIFPNQLDFGMTAIFQMYESLQLGIEITPSLVMTVLVTQVVSAVTWAPFFNMLFAFGEEVGWRGFLYPALLGETNCPVKAHLLTGLIWGLWHTPVNMMGHNYGTEYTGFPFLGILAMFSICFSMGVFFSWLVGKTGSIWPAALAHGSFNAVAGLTLYFVNPSVGFNQLLGPATSGLIAGIPMLVFAVILMLGEYKRYNAQPTAEAETIESFAATLDAATENTAQ